MPVRQMLPRSRSRYELPAWEISDDDGYVIGWVEQKTLRAASSPFYLATGVHPGTGRHVRLELSADLYERIAVVYEFRADPARFSMHVGADG